MSDFDFSQFDDFEIPTVARISEADQLIPYFDSKFAYYKNTLDRQVIAVENISREAHRQSTEAENYARNSSQIAESSKILANIATQKANKADVKSWIALGISFAAVVVEVMSNWNNIISFFQFLN